MTEPEEVTANTGYAFRLIRNLIDDPEILDMIPHDAVITFDAEGNAFVSDSEGVHLVTIINVENYK